MIALIVVVYLLIGIAHASCVIIFSEKLSKFRDIAFWTDPIISSEPVIILCNTVMWAIFIPVSAIIWLFTITVNGIVGLVNHIRVKRIRTHETS